MKLEQKREEEKNEKCKKISTSILSINSTRIFKERTYNSSIISECTRCECSRSTRNIHSTSLLFKNRTENERKIDLNENKKKL
jgi:hypothetical protein